MLPMKRHGSREIHMMKSNTQAIPALKVWLYDRPIDIINRLAGDRHIFSFEQDYIDDPNRPTLSLSLRR